MDGDIFVLTLLSVSLNSHIRFVLPNAGTILQVVIFCKTLMEDQSTAKTPKLLDPVSNALKALHYSSRTGEAFAYYRLVSNHAFLTESEQPCAIIVLTLTQDPKA